jgi:nitroreductase
MISLEDTLHLLRQRRSWKPASMDASREVEPALIESILQAARWAPTHGLTEPWRFRVFLGEGREILCQLLPTVYDQVTPAAEVRPEKRAKLGEIFLQVSVVVAIGCHWQPGGKIPLWEEQCAVAAAVQNMHLAATAAGLAAMWSSPPLCATEAGSRVLGFEPGVMGMGFFFIGWPQHPDQAPVAPPRRPMADRVAIISQP